MIAIAIGMMLAAVQAMPSPAVQAAMEARYLDEVGEASRRCEVMEPPRQLEYEEILQEYLLDLDAPELTSGQVECLANTPVLDTLTIEFADPSFYETYARARLARPDIKAQLDRAREEERARLDARGLLAGAPVFDPNQPISVYTTALETHCGVSPGSMLFVSANGREVTVSPGGDFDQFNCVFGLLSVSEVDMSTVGVVIAGEDSAP